MAETTPPPDQPRLVIGEWTADLRTGRVIAGDMVRAVEPKVMDLLFLLGSRPGEVFSRDEVMAALWPHVTVGDDTLARCVSKLRKALGDEAGASRYVETIPKRGYRLIPQPPVNAMAGTPGGAPAARNRRVAWVAGILAAVVTIGVLGVLLVRRPHVVSGSSAAAEALISRADDDYFQYSRADNEAAIELYRRALAIDPNHPRALAGLANAMVQRVVRWPNGPGGPDLVHPDLGKALRQGLTRTPAAQKTLAGARALAEQAVRGAPKDAAAYKALGFVRSAQGDFPAAVAAYDQALRLDPDAWGVMINLGDIHDIEGQPQAGLGDLERAYAAMSRAYEREPARIRPWQAALGVMIADRHAAAGRGDQAEAWYRRVLAANPFHKAATVGLAATLRHGGDAAAADRLCRELIARTGSTPGCRVS